jgi:hypothetical protein
MEKYRRTGLIVNLKIDFLLTYFFLLNRCFIDCCLMLILAIFQLISGVLNTGPNFYEILEKCSINLENMEM